MDKTPDIRIDNPLDWDAYKDKPCEQALPSIYKSTRDAAKRFTDWYWSSIRTKRRTSLGVRGAMLVLLVFGTLAPLLAGLRETPTEKLMLTQVGVCALALAGLLQVADKVFGWSSGWMRYITTATAMEALTGKFDLDWAAYVLNKGGHLADADVEPLFELGAVLQEALMQLQRDETDKWVAEFNSGAALLGEMIKSQRETADRLQVAATAAVAVRKTAVDASAKAALPGNIELTFQFTTGPVALNLSIDDGPAQAVQGSSWVCMGIPSGVHKLVVRAGTAGSTQVEKIVEVPAGGILRMVIAI